MTRFTLRSVPIVAAVVAVAAVSAVADLTAVVVAVAVAAVVAVAAAARVVAVLWLSQAEAGGDFWPLLEFHSFSSTYFTKKDYLSFHLKLKLFEFN